MPESPTIKETPQDPKQQSQESASQGGGEDIQAILSELETLQVKTPEDIRGMAVASQQAGRLANMLGEANRQIAELKSMISAQQSRPVSPGPYEAPEGGQSVDLSSLVEQSVWKVVNKIGEQTRAQQEALARELSWVRGNRRYKSVAAEFEASLQDYNTAQRIQSGELSIRDLFSEKLLEKYDKALMGTSEILKKYGIPGQTSPQHTESGGTRSVPAIPQTSAEQKAQRDILKNRAEGALSADQALEMLVQQMLTPSQKR
jgi:hypothetical protein